MDPPRNVCEVLSLGHGSVLRKTHPQLREDGHTPARPHHQGARSRWSQTEQAAFESLKDTLSRDTVLGYCETDQDSRLLAGAGPNGLGLVLMQKKP